MRKNPSETYPSLETEVAIVGAGPVGLMLANLLAAAGVQVTVLERNRALLGLPRAIAYDAETLRLFAQVGLLDEISPGLVHTPHVRHLNARARLLMAADLPARSLYGHSALGTFHQPDFEKALLKGLARFANARVLFEHRLDVLEQDACRVALTIATPLGRTACGRNTLSAAMEERAMCATLSARDLWVPPMPSSGSSWTRS
jgi:3-(3-hydroxy-phenyl)propionate hydroxylase